MPEHSRARLKLEEFCAVGRQGSDRQAKAMKDKNLTKMAELVQTSRASSTVCLLNPEQGNVTLDTLHRAAHALGRQLRVKLF